MFATDASGCDSSNLIALSRLQRGRRMFATDATAFKYNAGVHERASKGPSHVRDGCVEIIFEELEEAPASKGPSHVRDGCRTSLASHVSRSLASKGAVACSRRMRVNLFSNTQLHSSASKGPSHVRDGCLTG